MKKLTKNLIQGDIFFYPTSHIIYETLDRYYENDCLCIDIFTEDGGKFWKLKTHYDLHFEVIILSGNPTEVPPFLEDYEIYDFIYANSQCPQEIMTLYQQELDVDYSNSLEGFVLENAPCIRPQDFEHYTGLTPKDAKHIYFDEDALPIDIRAMELSEWIGYEIEPETIVEILLRCPRDFQFQKMKNLAQKFKELTGTPIYRFFKAGKKIPVTLQEECPF